MAGKARVLLATEGTYPYHLGGVSTWCDMLVRRIDEVDFTVFAVAMNPFVRSRFEFPANVRDIVTVPLWGTQDPSEHKEDLPFSEIFLQKQRTTDEVIKRSFLPDFLALLDEMQRDGEEAEAVGHALAAMHRYFSVFDYRETFKSAAVWEAFRDHLHRAALAGRWPEPSVFEAVQALGWMYHFFTVLNTPIPEVDVVHSSAAAFCGMVGVVAKITYGTPYLLTEHGVYLREQYLSVGRSNMSRFSKRFLLAVVRTIVRVNLQYADRVAPVCSFNARWERLLGVRRDSIQVVYNGVSADVFQPARDRREGPLRLLAVARSDPNKDLETLLRAMAIIHQHLPDVRLAIRGAVSVPDYHQRMLELRRGLGLDDVVDFGGHSDDPAALYRDADVLVQSSVSEAFPYAVIEGMMSGLPVVATDVGGTAEAIGDTGIAVPSRDPARLAAATIILLQDAALRRHLGNAARERALSLFTIRRATDEYMDLYTSLAQRRVPVASGLQIAASAAAARVPADAPAPRTVRKIRTVPAAAASPAAQREQLACLQKAFALRRIGVPVAALDQLGRALAAAPNSAAASTILAQIAEIEQELGQADAAVTHMAGAWLIAQVHGA